MILALLMVDWEAPIDPQEVEAQLFGKRMPPPLAANKPQESAPARRRSRPATAKPNAARAAKSAKPAAPPATPAAEPAARVPKRFRNLT